jgi:uncharacterized GH25 family protein
MHRSQPLRQTLRPRRGLAFTAATTVVAWLVAPLLVAHDFWIEPSAFRVEAGSRIGVALRVGERFEGDPVPRNPSRIRKLVLVGGAGATDVAGREGDDPAGTVVVPVSGLHVIGYHSKHSSVTLEAPKFEAYLKEEGLERVSALRRERGESGKPGREIFSRCAKALVLGGAGGRGGHDRRLGLPLELVPEADPYDAAAASVPLRLLHEGRPLEGALVVALSREAPDAALRARSDRDGLVRLELAPGRIWLVKAVHMIPAPKDSGADWESLWASLTFQR